MTPVTRSVVVAARITNGAGARSVAMAPTAGGHNGECQPGASNVTNYGPWLGTLTPKDALVGPHKIEAQEQIRGDMALCFVWAVSLPHASSQSRLPACRASNGYCRYAHWRLPSSRCRAGLHLAMASSGCGVSSRVGVDSVRGRSVRRTFRNRSARRRSHPTPVPTSAAAPPTDGFGSYFDGHFAIMPSGSTINVCPSSRPDTTTSDSS